MLKMGLAIGTGFVKCVSNCGTTRFPSLYVRRTHGDWGGCVEAVGDRAARMLRTPGAATIRPIKNGRPDPRYVKQTESLVTEAVDSLKKIGGREAEGGVSKIAVGLPYEASDFRESMARMVKKVTGAAECTVVAQAVGTLIDMGLESGVVVSIGQGTTEIVVIEDDEVIDGESSSWASAFVTGKIGKFAYLNTSELSKRKDACKKYARALAEGLAPEVLDKATSYSDRMLVISGGGILIPGVRDELLSRLKGLQIRVSSNPVMSNAAGLYKLVK